MNIGDKVKFYPMGRRLDSPLSGIIREFRDSKRGRWVVIGTGEAGVEYTTREGLVVK
jgi:hypothetical protein